MTLWTFFARTYEKTSRDGRTSSQQKREEDSDNFSEPWNVILRQNRHITRVHGIPTEESDDDMEERETSSVESTDLMMMMKRKYHIPLINRFDNKELRKLLRVEVDLYEGIEETFLVKGVIYFMLII
ncbi:10304_t:CDS:2 [Funneliformis caledonium]|uniref:10304_t:CDS:1 n=1 Tax=Funneliformis caledonium TaxID=1117310 RepID=A0A9N8V2B7_9GLOM|nr:10304_t:CDS:2 [Funneliformis caledonium]